MMEEEMMECEAATLLTSDPRLLSTMTTERKSQGLLIASRRGKVELIKLLLQWGARTNAEDEQRCTPLMFVAAQGLTDCVEAMIDSPGCTIHKRNESQQTALHFAAEKGQVDCVRCLVKNRSMVNLADDWGMTPLMLAVNSGSLESVTVLLNNGARLDMIDLRGFSALVHAAREGHSKIVRILIEHGSSVNLVGKTSPLHQASIFGNVDCVEILLEAGARSNMRDIHSQLPLELATQTDQSRVVDFLLQNTIQTEDDVNSALTTAARNNAYHSLELLLKHGANPDASQFMPTLFVAIDQNNIESVKLLIRHQCDIGRSVRKMSLYNSELRDLCMTLKLDYITAILIAVIRGYNQIALILLHAGARVDPLYTLLLNKQVADCILQDDQLMLWLLHRASRPLSLMEHCRALIQREMVRYKLRGRVDLLPLPDPLKQYLSYCMLDSL